MPQRPFKRRSRPQGLGHCAVAFVVLLAPSAAAFAQSAGGALDLARKIASAPACADLRLLGPCHCGPFACGARIRQYVPVAFVETTRAPGDSIFAGMATASLLQSGFAGTASSGISTTDNTAEAHVWLLSPALLSAVACLACAPSDAAVPAQAVDAADATCEVSSLVAQSIQDISSALAGAWMPALAYASEADAPNWRTGCRDLAAGATAFAPACSAAGAAPGVLGSASASPAQECIGGWGRLKPRQMRDIGPTPVLYSAKTAVRAMSIARTQLGTFPYPVDTDGRLQQIYPVASDCFAVGALPLPDAATSARPTAVSPDGRYGWIYWRRATCCMQPARLARCAGASASLR